MCILVTGGAGYIGSQMVLALRDAGQRTVVLDDFSTGFRRCIPADITLYEGDCGDERLLRDILVTEDVRTIVHFAGSIVVPESVVNPLAYYLNNTTKSRTLLAAAVSAGVKQFIFSSTAAVYGMTASIPVQECAPLLPISPYGSSKMMVEIMLRDVAAAHDLRYVALRYFNVAGADPANRTGQSSPVATHLIKVACQVAVGLRAEIEVYGDDYPTIDGTCVRDYIHVADLADAHVRALEYLSNGGGSRILNCGYGVGNSVLEVIDSVKRISGRDFPVRRAPRRPGDPPALVAAVELIQEDFGWSPRFDDLDTIVTHALAWEAKLLKQKLKHTM
jgi:UDP-glucose 4-epimerase